VTPRFPIYIPSKGRAQTRCTMRYLDSMGVPYAVIVEAPELDAYAAVIDRSRLLVLPASYQAEYDTCDDLGDSKSKGPGAARNFAWDHAQQAAAEFHWVMDDNIRGFYRCNRNVKARVRDGTVLRCMEDFVTRYTNVAMAGPNYEFFVVRGEHRAPFTLNTRIYSCNLIRTDLPFRWRGRYNEDTDLSLRMLKAGWCTVQFNAFLQKKTWTRVISGGCTDEFYATEGTLPKSRMLAELHPDVARVVWKFERWHHQVDYRPFQRNQLHRKPDLQVSVGVNDYGMQLIEVPRRATRQSG
jgi:hypothetical protein